MIKFKVSNNGKLLVGIGLSAANIEKLQEGKPLYVTLTDLGLEGTELAIVAGETEQSIVEDLKKEGLI